MTEKRFELNNIVKKGTVSFWDNDKQVIINASSILDLLNKFNDENEQLKSICQDHRDHAIDFKADCVRLEKENEQLKHQIKKLEAQLYKVEDGVCNICNNMYLVQQGRYFVSKCKKGHDECSKMDLDYCDDFELKDGDVE